MQSRHFKSRFDLEDRVPVSAVTLTRLGKQFQITEPCFFPCVQRAGRLTLLRIRQGYQNVSHSSIFWTLALAFSNQIPRGQLESLRWTDVLLPHLVFCSVLSAPRGHKYFSHINVSRALFSGEVPTNDHTPSGLKEQNLIILIWLSRCSEVRHPRASGLNSSCRKGCFPC